MFRVRTTWLGFAFLLTACGGAAHRTPPQLATVTMAPMRASPPEPRPFIAPRDPVFPTRGPRAAEQQAIDATVAHWTAECFVDWMRNAPFRDGHAEFDLVYERTGQLALVHLASSDIPAETTDCLRKGLSTTSLEATDARVAVRMPIELVPPPTAPPEPVLPPQKR